MDGDGLKDYGLDFLVWTIIFPIALINIGLLLRWSSFDAGPVFLPFNSSYILDGCCLIKLEESVLYRLMLLPLQFSLVKNGGDIRLYRESTRFKVARVGLQPVDDALWLKLFVLSVVSCACGSLTWIKILLAGFLFLPFISVRNGVPAVFTRLFLRLSKLNSC